MHLRSLVLYLALAFAQLATSHAQTPARAPQSVPSPRQGKPEPPDNPAEPRPRAPVAGQPFDDRELALFLEGEARKLSAAGRFAKLNLQRRTCALPLPEANAVSPGGWAAIAARAEAATVVIGELFREAKDKKDQFSTAAGGFLLTADGAFVTCLHVVSEKGARGFVALMRDGRVFPVREVLAADPVEDLVILQLEVPLATVLPTLPLAAEPPAVGSSIGVMSHPDERFYLFTTGTVSRHTVWREREGEEHFMSITADFAKGSSGCPVLDERGAVAGVVNNTESIYYDNDGRRRQNDLQMVVKNVTPSWAVRRLCSGK